jgi:CheY-like chemotaxis protein
MLRDHPLAFADDGRQALTRLREQPDIDLVLLDINMPNMDGRQFLAELRRVGGLDRVRVVIVTTEGHAEDARRGLEAGAAAYITKPFRSEEIRTVIARLDEGAP